MSMGYDWKKDALHYAAVLAALSLGWVGGMAFWQSAFPLNGGIAWAALAANLITAYAVLVVVDKGAHAALGIA